MAHIVVEDIIKQFKLQPSLAITYSLIYGFSQDGESDFHGSLRYLRSWIFNPNGENICEEQMRTILKSLVEKGLVEIIHNSGKPSFYRARLDVIKQAGNPPSIVGEYPPRKVGDTPQEKLGGHIDKSILDSKEIIKGDNAHTQEIDLSDFFKVFDAWWDMYDKKEWGGDANDVRHMIASLTLAEREQLMKYTSAYVSVTTKDKRKQPRYFFKDQMWRNDISTILPNATTLNYLDDPMTEWKAGRSVAMVRTEQGVRYLTIADANAAGMDYKEMKPQN